MKALEILKKIYINNPDTRFQRNNIDINFTIHDFSNVNEAIKELEALENRSCEGCKNAYYQDVINDLDDGTTYVEPQPNDLIAEIPKELHQYIIQTIKDYYTDLDFKATVDSVSGVKQ